MRARSPRRSSAGRAGAHVVPSTDPRHDFFEPLRYWRGPIWAVVNWMIAEGFAAAGSERRRDAHPRGHAGAWCAGAGFSEYFDPLTGRGIGGGTFSWTAAIFLMLEERR